MHLIRAAMRFVSYHDRKKVAAALRPIYTAPTVEAAETELLAFADSPLGRRYPAAVATWENAWERFIPFLAFPPELRKIIYTTNAIESLNYQLRKIIKNRGHFPNDDAVIKLLWLAIRDIEDKRARATREGEGPAADPAHRARPARRRRHRAGLESRPRRPRPGLPRPPRRLPHLTAFPPSWPSLPAAPEASTWSARSAARTNDVDTDKRWKTINSGGNQHH